MKIISYYLPQFHEIDENNLWWGDGFTEWTNVKKATALYHLHNQPLTPLNQNYYDLMNKSTVVWQANLAQKYNVFGFCYYHYWFMGRKILEKPAENLLKWRDINKKYCFCWANHSWQKTWNGSKELLIEQKYGNEEEWEEHINYLMPFFLDERYIKINNKPVFLIFISGDVNDLDKRISYYNKRCIDNGFAGLYFIESINNSEHRAVSELSSGITLREPNVGLTSSRTYLEKVIHRIKSGYKKNYLMKPMRYDYERVIQNSLRLAESFEKGKKLYLGSFSGWDSTPRHGRRGYVIDNNDNDKFELYLKEQKKLIQTGFAEEFVFFNAWNEWAEGMYLEPDERNKYKILEIIRKYTTHS